MNIKFAVISCLAVLLQAYAARSADLLGARGPFPYEISGNLVGEYYLLGKSQRDLTR